jgi:hypothetical protein
VNSPVPKCEGPGAPTPTPRNQDRFLGAPVKRGASERCAYGAGWGRLGLQIPRSPKARGRHPVYGASALEAQGVVFARSGLRSGWRGLIASQQWDSRICLRTFSTRGRGANERAALTAQQVCNSGAVSLSSMNWRRGFLRLSIAPRHLSPGRVFLRSQGQGFLPRFCGEVRKTIPSGAKAPIDI